MTVRELINRLNKMSEHDEDILDASVYTADYRFDRALLSVLTDVKVDNGASSGRRVILFPLGIYSWWESEGRTGDMR